MPKAIYKIIRVRPDDLGVLYPKNLGGLEDALNDGFIIERVEEIHGISPNSHVPITVKDYILFKFEKED